MRRQSLFWQLFLSYLLITLGVLAALSLYASHTLHRFHRGQTRSHLEARAELAEMKVRQLLQSGETAGMDALCGELARRGHARFTLILPDGTVVGDSEEDPARMDDHSRRPEIRRALVGETGASVRRSRTLQREMMYVAVPVEIEGRLAGVVRTSLPLKGLAETLSPIYGDIVVAAAAIALVAVALSVFAARRVTGPLADLQRGARRFAQGDLDHKVPVANTREIASLGEAMNVMASRLHDRIRTVIQQRNELEAVLGSMTEGVLALDEDQHVLRINASAAELLSCDAAAAVGRSIQEVVRNPGLQAFVGEALDTDEPLEGDLTVPMEKSERHLQARATPLLGADGIPVGTLIVVNDVTRLRRLENIRREFVANVSHELRTPITAIKGFAETLLEHGPHSPEERERFLGIIDRQADRLQELFNDLLTLSRAEREAERGEIALQPEAVGAVLESAAELARPDAEEKGIRLTVECPGELRAQINPPLFEQAVFNLVDNAVRYSPPDTAVRVDARREGDEIVVCVSDEGPGVEAEHLDRLFERFYRIGKGRDRGSGGTGLGLAIVKHIAQSHHGTVGVESTPGKGSTFRIHIPAI
ncbi:MAG: ATP-binding protein [Armatimonadota bacterium]